FSGYGADDHAPDESSGVLLIGRETALLYTSANNTAWAASEAPDFAVEAWKRPWEAFIAAEAERRGWRRIGFEDRGLVVASHEALRSAAGSMEWIPLGGMVDALRACKSSAELDALAKAIQLTDAVYEEIARTTEPGMTEAEVGWKIERLTRELVGG